MRSISVLVLLALAGCRTTIEEPTETGLDATDAVDSDLDGFLADDDCDDTNAFINPDADELCDGVDNNCDGSIDGADAIDALTFYADADGDGHGDANSPVEACALPDGLSTLSDDCDDA
ncbi:MAG: hypothetical protein ACJAZO_005036, partial [Myxococcota bacterium]